MSAPDAKRPPRQGRPLDNSSPGSDTDILAEVLTCPVQLQVCPMACPAHRCVFRCPEGVTE